MRLRLRRHPGRVPGRFSLQQTTIVRHLINHQMTVARQASINQKRQQLHRHGDSHLSHNVS